MVGIIVGAALGLFGYRLFRITLFVVSFLVFAAVSYALLLLSDLEQWEDTMIACIIGVVCGLLTVILAQVAILLLGVLTGASIGLVIAAQIDWGDNDWAGYVLIGGLALVCGVLFLFLQKLFIITGTSVVGAFGFVGGISELANPDNSITNVIAAFLRDEWTEIDGSLETYLQLGAIALLALIFFLFQYLWSAKNCDHRHPQGGMIVLVPVHGNYETIQEHHHHHDQKQQTWRNF
ncbi:MAG: DUF4203 domain-containing protein [archaeon]|nr:DUF4203 domain-containing protein [archaeon]